MTETEALVKANIEKHKKLDEGEWDDEALKEAQDNIEFVKQFKEELSKESLWTRTSNQYCSQQYENLYQR